MVTEVGRPDALRAWYFTLRPLRHRLLEHATGRFPSHEIGALEQLHAAARGGHEVDRLACLVLRGDRCRVRRAGEQPFPRLRHGNDGEAEKQEQRRDARMPMGHEAVPTGTTPSARSRLTSRIGARPKKRAYSRLNCDGLT